ncbi:hypothetical protein D1BOALGB6SA_7783 [Olavius sp. associated proteobacterium Delta 1]|nr:hypothetical protein D1BOALGB6SA_7783 [Olavius sp. associated proteobacterium Delta 1]
MAENEFACFGLPGNYKKHFLIQYLFLDTSIVLKSISIFSQDFNKKADTILKQSETT